MNNMLRTVLAFIGGAALGTGLLFVALPRKAPAFAPSIAADASGGRQDRVDDASSPTRDARIAFTVTSDAQAHIKGQMLSFLIDIQSLNSALAASDRELIRDIASRQAKPQDPKGFGQQLKQTAPEGFTQISQALRRDFADLADASETEPVEQLQDRVAGLMGKCVACHGSYAVSNPPSE